MQSTRNLVPITAKFTTSVKNREYDLNGRFAAVMHIDRNTTAIIDNRDAVIPMDGHIDLITIARQRLIDRIVYDLINKMMQATLWPTSARVFSTAAMSL